MALLPQLRALAPSYDGTRPLPRRLERAACLVAAQELTQPRIAALCQTSVTSIKRLQVQPPFKARVAYLREQYRAAAYDAAPLVDKRNRVVMAAQLAETLHRQGQAKAWRDTVAVTKQGTEITGFDWRRTDQVRQLLDYIAKEVGDRSAVSTTSTTVNVGISMEDAAIRVQALLSRLPDAIDAESQEVKGGSTSLGGREGSTP